MQLLENSNLLNFNIPVTGVVLTFNEENIIEKCILGLRKITDNIIIVDSYSSDQTINIAKNNGCLIFQNKFEGYAKQRNFALNLIDDSSWVLMIDADEIISDELAEEIAYRIQKGDDDVLLVKRREIFLNKSLFFAAGNGLFFPRFFKNGKVKVEREINERYLISGTTHKLKNRLWHFSFNKGINSWILKHNDYSTLEVNNLFSCNKSYGVKSFRHIIKDLMYKSKIKLPLLIIIYFFRFPFLDGWRGIYYVLLKLVYEVQISVKVAERKYIKK